jgi:hypothetical protein
MYIGVAEYTTAAIITNKFSALHGFNTESQKPSMAVFSARSRIECSIKCEEIFGCGGFNYRPISPGRVECNLTQGQSNVSVVQIQNGVTYYQKLDKCMYLIHVMCNIKLCNKEYRASVYINYIYVCVYWLRIV